MREMRRHAQMLSKEQANKILEKCEYGIFSVTGDEGFPYGVPVNHVFDGKNIYFHGAVCGHKTDAAKGGAKASFCVVQKCEVNAEALSTKYESVIAFGNASIVEDENETREALVMIIEKFAPDYMDKGLCEIEREWEKTNVFKIETIDIKGKFHK